ncbi:MAG TPA: hypothetical protein VGR27_15305 [Longimicrobiaceae bacterium]|nr:hypothetical protein [Longimicrobiaceae bacterium]
MAEETFPYALKRLRSECYPVLTFLPPEYKLRRCRLVQVPSEGALMLATSNAAYSGSLPRYRLRDGSNPIERKAVYRAQLEIRSMPASLVVQIALWPDKLADWAKETAIAPSVVYNMLANVKPYHRVRTLLARRLNVPKQELDHLIEAPRPEPLAKLPPEPPELPAPANAVVSAAPRYEARREEPLSSGEPTPALLSPRRRRAVHRQEGGMAAPQIAMNI